MTDHAPPTRMLLRAILLAGAAALAPRHAVAFARHAPRPVREVHLTPQRKRCRRRREREALERPLEFRTAKERNERTASSSDRDPGNADASPLNQRENNTNTYDGSITASTDPRNSEKNYVSHQTFQKMSSRQGSTSDQYRHQSESRLDRTTARLLDPSPFSSIRQTPQHPDHDPNASSSSTLGRLTSDDVSLIATLMTSHARRSSVRSALVCERLLKRVVEEVDAGNAEVGATTKIYTVAMDAWAKSQRRPRPGSVRARTPVGAAAQRAHRIHNFLVSAFRETRSTHLAPSTISYNAVINAWSKSYHPGSGEMAEVLLREMLHEWRWGRKVAVEGAEERQDEDRVWEEENEYGEETGGNDRYRADMETNSGISTAEKDVVENGDKRGKDTEGAAAVVTADQRGNERVKPDVVTFTAVVDAWVKCTALVHDYQYEPPPPSTSSSVTGDLPHSTRIIGANSNGHKNSKPMMSSNSSSASPNSINLTSNDFQTTRNGLTSMTTEIQNYAEWKRLQSARADKLTQRAAGRAKQLLRLMIWLGHYDPERHGDNATTGDGGRNGENVVMSVNEGDNDGVGRDGSVPNSNHDNLKDVFQLARLKHCEPGMRPNCYTYSAVMNALAKSCTVSRAVSSKSNHGSSSSKNRGRGSGIDIKRHANYNPAQEAQDILESMIAGHQRYCERVGVSLQNLGGATGEMTRYSNGGSKREERRPGMGAALESNRYNNEYDDMENWIILEKEKRDSSGVKENTVENGEDADSDFKTWMEGSWTSAAFSRSLSSLQSPTESDEKDSSSDTNNSNDKKNQALSASLDPHWYEPRPDELTFPPNTINYNSVLNAWSCASRYDPFAAERAESILAERMEQTPERGGDPVMPDVLSYSLVVHAWLRGCRGYYSHRANRNNNGDCGLGGRSSVGGRRHFQQNKNSNNGGVVNSREEYTDKERIERAMEVIDRLEDWLRRTHAISKRIWTKDQQEKEIDENEEKNTDKGIDDNWQGSIDFNTSSFDLSDIPILPRDKLQQYRFSTVRFTQHSNASDLDVELYNSVLVAYSREQIGDHAASVLKLLDRMETLADDLEMESVRPNSRSYNVALEVIRRSAASIESSLKEYYRERKGDAKEEYAQEMPEKEGNKETPEKEGNKETNPFNRKARGNHSNQRQNFNHNYPKQQRSPNLLYSGHAAESILGHMLSSNVRPDANTFASILNTYQRIPNGRLGAALAADNVLRGMESLHLQGKIDKPPDVFHYTMVCACWSRSGQKALAGERCSEILRHMTERADKTGYERIRPNIRTLNAVIASYGLAEAEDMLMGIVDSYESSVERSLDGTEDEVLPVRPDSFSFNTVIQRWARARNPEGGRRAEAVLERMLKFHYDGNAGKSNSAKGCVVSFPLSNLTTSILHFQTNNIDVRPDERSFAYIIHHYTKGAGRSTPEAPDRALKLLRKMISLYKQGYKELLPRTHNKTNPIFTFASVVGAHSVLRRSDAGIIGEELLEIMTRLGETVEALKPNTYMCLSVLYGWSSCGSVDAGERATALLRRMEEEMANVTTGSQMKAGEFGNKIIKPTASSLPPSIMQTTQRCYVLAQTAWARSPSGRKAEGALEVLEMMEKNYAGGNMDAKPTVQAYSMVRCCCTVTQCTQPVFLCII